MYVFCSNPSFLSARMLNMLNPCSVFTHTHTHTHTYIHTYVYVCINSHTRADWAPDPYTQNRGLSFSQKASLIAQQGAIGFGTCIVDRCTNACTDRCTHADRHGYRYTHGCMCACLYAVMTLFSCFFLIRSIYRFRASFSGTLHIMRVRDC